MRNQQSRYLDWAFCFSLPVILMLKNWDILVFRNINKEYFSYEPNAYSYLGAILLVAAMSAVTAFGLRTYRRTTSIAVSWTLRVLFLASFLVVAGFVRESQGFSLSWLHGLRFRYGSGADIVLLGAVGVVGLMCLYYLRFISRAVFVLVVALTPFALGIIAQAGWGMLNGGFPQTTATTDNEAPTKHKVVVLLFDELDTRVLFDRRPDGWTFPAFDELRSHALYAPNTLAPGGSTIRAIPALLTGKAVTKSEITHGPELAISFEDGGEALFGEADTVFHRADKLGFRSAVIGFHHPYCRLFSTVLAECHRIATATPELEPPQSLLASIRRQFLGLSILHFRQAAIASYKITKDRGVDLSERRDTDLVFIHATVPHYPPIYNAQKAAFTLLNIRSDGYFDNVALADRFLADFRGAMEANGAWDDLTLIVTADHGWRDGRYRFGSINKKVPFFVKLPNQVGGLEYSPEMSSLVIADLLIEALSGNIQQPVELVNWLRHQRPSPNETAAVE